MCDQQSLRSACAYAQSDQSLSLSLEFSMSVKLLAEHNLEFLSLEGGCTGSPDSTLVKIPHCWKSHVTAQFYCVACEACRHIGIRWRRRRQCHRRPRFHTFGYQRDASISFKYYKRVSINKYRSFEFVDHPQDID